MATTKRIGAMTAVILSGALAAFGCSAAPGTSATDSPSQPGAPGTNVDVAEVEPNDGPDAAGAQNIGALAANETVTVKGQLASGGTDGQKYTGDWDLFAFDVTEAGEVDVKVDWTASADVDVAVYDPSAKVLGSDGAQGKPASVKVASASGKILVALFSKDNATPYTLTVSHTKAASAPGTTPGTCPTTPLVPAKPAGGCTMRVVNPVCAEADLRNGGSFELDWSTDMTFCEGPHKITIAGDPPSAANSVTYSIASTYTGNDASMTRNSGGYMKITAKDIASLSSSTGIYYWGVADFYGASSEGVAFRVLQ